MDQSDRYVFKRVDICDRDQVDRVFREHQPDAIMYLAAESRVDRSISCPSEFIQTNIIGTYTLLGAACHYWGAMGDGRKASTEWVAHVKSGSYQQWIDKNYADRSSKA